MIVLVDFTFDDQITLGIDTLMIVNWPQEAMASLPISISFSVKRFSGTLAIELGQYSLAYSIINDFVLDFEVKSLMGHRTKIKDLPKLTNLITRKLRQLFVEHLVFPAQHSMNLF